MRIISARKATPRERRFYEEELTAPMVEVEILNPYNEREFLDDKLSIVDVKARDAGGRLDAEHLPAWMDTEEMQQAMSTLKAFSEKTRAYHQYQARQNYWRQQQSLQNHLNALLAQAEQARAAEGRECAEKEAALAEIERLKALLRN